MESIDLHCASCLYYRSDPLRPDVGRCTNPAKAIYDSSDKPMLPQLTIRTNWCYSHQDRVTKITDEQLARVHEELTRTDYLAHDGLLISPEPPFSKIEAELERRYPKEMENARQYAARMRQEMHADTARRMEQLEIRRLSAKRRSVPRRLRAALAATLAPLTCKGKVLQFPRRKP